MQEAKRMAQPYIDSAKEKGQDIVENIIGKGNDQTQSKTVYDYSKTDFEREQNQMYQ